ncbi:MAG: D-glycero-beta-D-manno-heptose-7-phosphate kinase [Candidatus Omnitrophota bacterium]
MNTQQANKIISGFRNAKVLVIGDLMLDEFIWGDVSRISPEAPVPVVKVSRSSYMPGGSCNVVNNINALGGEVYACGIIGQDQTGALLIDELRERAINTEGIFIDKSKPTIKKTRIIAQHQQVVRVDREVEGQADNFLLNKIFDFIQKKASLVDAIVIEDYGKGLIQPKLIKFVIRLASKYKKIVVVDPKEENFQYYKGVTLVTPNHHELETATSIKVKDRDSLKKACVKLLNMLKCKAVLATLGDRGMALLEDSMKFITIPTVAREVFDVSGAGDTVVASFTLAKLAGAKMREAAYISNVAAGIVVGKLGVAVVTPEELRAELKRLI